MVIIKADLYARRLIKALIVFLNEQTLKEYMYGRNTK